MVAIALLKGTLQADDYEDTAAADPRIDSLRKKMEVIENPQFTRDYLEPAKRSIGNAIQVFFEDGSFTKNVSVEYPIGHFRRRQEGLPLLLDKFEYNLRKQIPPARAIEILRCFSSENDLERMPVHELIDLFVL
jgi:2-methylcitrate dehydratase